MGRRSKLKIFVLYVTTGLPFVLTHPAFAEAAGVDSVDSFIRSLIKVAAGIAGLIATGFFVVGGFTYITSSGNPDHMDRAKRTIIFSALGLAITIGAFVISNIVTSLATSSFGS